MAYAFPLGRSINILQHDVPQPVLRLVNALKKTWSTELSFIDLFTDLITNRDYEEKPVSILVVEDDPVISRLWAQALYGKCNDVVIKQDLSSTMSYLADHDADILILDWKLPNGDANAILNHWLGHFDGPVAVVSGLIDDEDEKKFYQRGAWHVLRKPVDITVFISILSRYIELVRRRNQREWSTVEIRKLKRKQSALLALLVVALTGQQIVNYLV